MEIEENHRKERQKGAERKSQLKCDFSDAKETRAAPLPVIGLALFPKNLSSALHLLLPCSAPLPPSLSRAELPHAAVSWVFWSMAKQEAECWWIQQHVGSFYRD